MTDKYYILKERLTSKINGRSVKAALFYTFNFDPQFFENYIMPILVPGQNFTNNNITNNILWRRLYKDNIVPPVTVYFDQNAKGKDSGPYLDYKLVAVNMPMVGKNKGNFHPKHSFVLVENTDRTLELILLTGSNNISQSGWCENLECISEHELINGIEFPYDFKKSINKFINNVFNSYGKIQTYAELLISGYLNKIGYTKEKNYVFYDSFQSSFIDFLQENILEDNSIKTVEIISPYFNSTPTLIENIIAKKIQVRIQAPIKNDYCLIDKSVIENYAHVGVKWFYPLDDSRNTHSKVYRFYGAENTYTIIGSVNLTQPAWEGVVSVKKQIYNIESAVLFVDKEVNPSRLFKKEISVEKLQYLPTESSAENSFERIEIPDIVFTINWINKTLSWINKAKNKCKIELSTKLFIDVSGRGSISFMDFKNGLAILESLSRKPLIKVIESTYDGEQVHYYYMEQIGFECRPIEYRLSTNEIIDGWELLGTDNNDLNDWLTTRLETLIDLAQDESGKLIDTHQISKSLLNEMARYFYGLSKLESYLFNDNIYKKNKVEQEKHFNNVHYYLINDNVDTLYSFWKMIQKQYESTQIMRVYYWLLISILKLKFYENTQLKRLTKHFSHLNKTNEIKNGTKKIIDELNLEIFEIEKTVKVDKKKLKWATNILESDYGNFE